MTIQEQITATAGRYGVPPQIALAVAQRESGFNQAAVGTSGERGVMQLMPATAAALGVNPYDLSQNIDGGVRLLREEYDRFGDWTLAIAAYNTGSPNVLGGTIPPSTRKYVSDVLAIANWPGVPSYIPPVSPLTDTAGFSPDFSVTGYGQADHSTVIWLLLAATVVLLAASSSS